MDLSPQTPRGIDKTKRYGWVTKDEPGELRMLHKDQLQIHPAYQRTGAEQSVLKVTEITANWSHVACGALVVAQRDGEYWVIDGGHRVAAAKRRSDISFLPCVVFKTESVRQEALGFLDVNTGRKPVTAYTKHKAMLAAMDEHALFVQKVCEQSGVLPTNAGRTPGTIRCVSWLVRRAREDREATAKVVRLAAELSTKDQMNVVEVLCSGLWFLNARCGDGLEDRRLVSRLREKGARALIIGAQKAAAYHGHGGSKVHAEGMLTVLNAGLRHKFSVIDADQAEDDE